MAVAKRTLRINGKRFREVKVSGRQPEGGTPEPVYGGEEEPIDWGDTASGATTISCEMTIREASKEYAEIRRLMMEREEFRCTVQDGTVFRDPYRNCRIPPFSDSTDDGHVKTTVSFDIVGIPIRRTDAAIES